MNAGQQKRQALEVLPRSRHSPIACVLLAVLGSNLPALTAHADESAPRTLVPWAVLPARSSAPPPRDPSLSRLSREVEDALRAATGAPVSLLSPELRDDACASDDGLCPRDVPTLVRARNVLSLVLRPDHSTLELKLFVEQRGLVKKGQLACRWDRGLVACETERLAEVLDLAPAASPAPDRAPKPSKPPRAKLRSALQISDPEPPEPVRSPGELAFRAALASAKPRLQACARKGWGETAAADRSGDARVRARIGEGGALKDVRLEPPSLSDAPAFACMARLVESLTAAPEHAGPMIYEHGLPGPGR